MVTLTLNAVPAGAKDYQVIATMRIAVDGTYQVHDPDSALPLGFPVLVTEGISRLPSTTATVPEITVDQDAEMWARNLHNFLRTGYVVPAIFEDDADAPQVGDSTPLED